MQFQIESDVLSDAVSQVVALVPRRPMVPVYAFIRLQALPGKIVVSGYNGSVGLVKSIALGANDVKEAGDLLLLGHDLLDRLNLITADELKIASAKKPKPDSPDAIDIITKSGKLRLGCVTDTSSFPTIPMPAPSDPVLTVKEPDKLLALMRLGTTCTLPETEEVMSSQKMNLTCVALNLRSSTEFAAYSSNLTVMLKGTVAVDTEGGLSDSVNTETLLRLSVIAAVRKAFRGATTLEIVQTSSAVFFKSEEAMMIAHIPNVSFPVNAIKQVVNFAETVSATVNRVEFLLSLKKAALYSDAGYIAVITDAQNPMVAVNSQPSEIGYSNESLSDVTIQGIESDVFKVRLEPLIQVIERMEGEFLAVAHKGYKTDLSPHQMRFSQVADDATIQSGMAFMPLALSTEADAHVRSTITGNHIVVKTPVAA